VSRAETVVSARAWALRHDVKIATRTDFIGR
jgi:hypothetical protein